jgi:hypothetical protein
MPAMNHLSELPETMTSIAAYLLVAHHRHPKLILGKPEDQVLETRSTIRIRVTQHYTAALLAYGFTADTPELQWATEWFATPFPKRDMDVIDVLEMTRLEGLLNLRSDDLTVQPRLEQLIRQKNDQYFEIDRADDHDTPTPIFDTLWALKVLMLARTQGLIDGLLTTAEIRAMLNRMTEIAVYDKDVALALRLQYELTGKLTRSQEDVLRRLIKRSEQYGYVWGIHRQDMWERVRDIAESMRYRQLTPSIIDQQGDAFREMILNMCYVIENLAPLGDVYPEVIEALERSLNLWWRQFQGDNAPMNIRTLFPKEYDFLMVMCRTLVAVSSYVGEPLSALCWLPSLRRMSQTFGNGEWEEAENIKRALRQWIDVELIEHQELKLGLSEANVVRIKPGIYNPMDDNKDDLLRTSLVVKYGPAEEIEGERRNYSSLPGRIRHHFVSIPAASYTDSERQLVFVIMQDLNHYQTLYEVYDRLLKPDNPRLGGLLSEFLVNIHRGDGEQPSYSLHNHVRELYLLPMLQHLNYLAAHMQNRDIYTDEHIQRFNRAEGQLSQLIAGVMQYQQQIKRFPLAYMHGDLHSRNIMIRMQQKQGIARRAEYDFKLIDLESLRADGDAAHDAGQLMIDLNLLQITGKKNLNRSVYAKLADMQHELAQAYLNFAAERGDESFVTRLMLAKARAILRIAKGRAKRTERHLRRREYHQAQAAVSEILNLTEESVEHLREAYSAVCP